MGAKRPGEYEDRERGRIVEGVFNFGNSSGRLYETEYAGVREALEELRSESRTAFRSAISHVINKTNVSDEEHSVISKKMRGTVGGLDSEVVQWIIQDWHKDSPSLRKNYEPSYFLSIAGQPVQNSVYDAIAKDIEELRAGDPAVAKSVEMLLKQGIYTDLIYPETWFKKNASYGDGLARRDFMNAVSNFRPIDIKIAQEVIKNNPYREQVIEILQDIELEQGQEEALEIS